MENKVCLENLLKQVNMVLGGRDIVDAKVLVKRCKELLPSLTDKIDLINCNYSIYRLLEFLKEDEESLVYLSSALGLDPDYEFKYHLYQEIALCQMRMKKKEDGLAAFQKAYELAEQENDNWKIADISRWFAQYYYQEMDFMKALEYLNESIVYARKVHNFPMESEAYLKMGVIFYRQKKYNLALDNLREAEDLAVDAHNLLFTYRAAIKRCKIYMDLGNQEEVFKIIDTLFIQDEPANLNSL